jgi:hypothetical protein
MAGLDGSDQLEDLRDVMEAFGLSNLNLEVGLRCLKVVVSIEY